MSTITKLYTFSSGATILAEEHNTNFDTLYNWANGNITNSNIKSGAAIALSKLDLTNDATFSGDLTFSGDVVIGTANQGDILYDDGTKLTRLTPGTDGQVLTTKGAAANPEWATVDAIPTGIICMWSGTISTVPTGWYLCDGDNSTPDLRDRFIVGAKEDDSGVAKTNVTGSLTQSGDGQIPSHTHTMNDAGFTLFTVGAGTGNTYTPQAAGGSPQLVTGTSGTGTTNIAVYYALAFIMKG